MEHVLNLLKVSVIVSCVVLALILLRPVLDRRYHAKWKYYVWLCLALALLLPLSPLGDRMSEVAEEYAPIQITVPDIDRRFDAMEDMVTAPAMPVVPAMPTEDLPAGTVDTPLQQRPGAPKRNVEDVVELVWVMGMAAFAAYYAAGTALFYRRSLRWSREAEPEITDRAKVLMEEMGIDRLVPVRVSSVVTSPMMIGFLRPKLLLNEGDYSRQELDFILRHELTHYKRRDIWYKLALLCANCVHWFNPFAYLLVREAAIDMELTCDDAVVAGGDAAVRRAYSETLLASLHRQSGVNAALSTFFYGGKETMKERFRNIMGVGKRRRGVVALLLVLTLTISAACLIGCQGDGKKEPVVLTAEELAQWQEKLNTPAYNGFVTHMYSKPEYIRVNQLIYSGADIGYTPAEAEIAAYLAEIGAGEQHTDIVAVKADALENYLQENIGLKLAAFPAPLPGWTDMGDAYFTMHGDTNAVSVEVLSGTTAEDTVALELANVSGYGATTTLTIKDGKFFSHTNTIYTAAETVALEQAADFAASGTGWIDNLYPITVFDGEQGTYVVWSASLNGSASMLIFSRIDDGQLILLSSEGTNHEGHDGWNHLHMDYTLEEYVRYAYDYDFYPTLMGRSLGWPQKTAQLVYGTHAGANPWATTQEGVLTGWLLGWGDALADYEIVSKRENDAIIRCTTSEGRTVLVLMGLVDPDFHGLTYYEVLGYRIESGADFPERRIGEDTREQSATLSIVLEGMEEPVPAYLYSGGGDYGIREWSMYIPYQNWSCNYLTNRWCPMPEDMALSIQVLEHGSSYSFEQFYQSYREQFDQVWTNENQAELGVNVAHALGYQDTAGGRYTESQLFFGNGKFYEVMWTYSAEQAEGWGTRLGWTAATFRIIGDNTAYEVGELVDGTRGEVMVVTQAQDEYLVSAGTYLVLPSAWAFRLEDYLEQAKSDLIYSLRWNADDFAGDPEPTLSWQGTFDYGHERDGVMVSDTTEVFELDWAIPVKEGVDRNTDENGCWHYPNRTYLLVERNDDTVLKTAVVAADDASGAIAAMTDGQEHTTHPAIRYYREAEQLVAIGGQPMLPPE